MEAFEKYIRNEYQQDIRELKNIENLICDSSNTLMEVFETCGKYWPPEIKKTEELKKNKEQIPSTSTTAMILLSLEKITNPKTQNKFKSIEIKSDCKLVDTKKVT